MEIQNILALIQAFTEHSLTELNVEDGSVRISLKKDTCVLGPAGRAAGAEVSISTAGASMAAAKNPEAVTAGGQMLSAGAPTIIPTGTPAVMAGNIPTGTSAAVAAGNLTAVSGTMAESPVIIPAAVPVVSAAPQAAAGISGTVISQKEQAENALSLDSDNIVVSPLVGIFYSASSPEAENFVKVGDKVKKGQVLGIIEAMKLMNEIESDFDGVVEAILVNNEDVVEYGQPLFRIR